MSPHPMSRFMEAREEPPRAVLIPPFFFQARFPLLSQRETVTANCAAHRRRQLGRSRQGSCFSFRKRRGQLQKCPLHKAFSLVLDKANCLGLTCGYYGGP
jgi:hypothetical protein